VLALERARSRTVQVAWADGALEGLAGEGAASSARATRQSAETAIQRAAAIIEVQ
jgi:hypothetical protein